MQYEAGNDDENLCVNGKHRASCVFLRGEKKSLVNRNSTS